MTIILDTSGGTDAPEAQLEAAARSSLARELQLVLVGDEATITQSLARKPHDPSRIMVRHADGPVGEHLGFAAKLLSEDPGAALVTASDPSAVTAIAAEHLTLLPSVEHPAVCAVYPTARRRGHANDPFVLILDVAAAPTASVDALLGFARMGSAYAARISRNSKPKVAVLAGREGSFAPPETLEAIERLKGHPDFNFIGPIGGVDISRGTADVIVCQGFVGNTVVRLLEGVGELSAHLARSIEEQGLRARMALKVISGDMRAFASIADWRQYGGAPLLGYDRSVILTDPAASADTIERAIRLAAKTIRTDIVGAIRDA